MKAIEVIDRWCLLYIPCSSPVNEQYDVAITRQDAGGSLDYIFILFVNNQCSQLVKLINQVINQVLSDLKILTFKVIRMEFTTTEKENRKLIHGGYMYAFQKNLANDVTSYECEKRRRGECKPKIKLDEAGNFLERINNHILAPSETKCEIAKVRANIKRRATETQDPAQVLLGRVLGEISKIAAINLPALHHIRRNIRLQRQVNQQVRTPAKREDAPESLLKYQRSYANEQFLIFDCGQGDADSIFIFGTNQSLQLLSHPQNWFGDGTFRFAPRYFFRYTLFMHKLTDVFPPAFTLCSQTKPKKLIPDYSEKLNNTWQTLVPIF